MTADTAKGPAQLRPLSEFSIIAFDLYSSLIDREAGILDALVVALQDFQDDYPDTRDLIEGQRRDWLMGRFEWQQAVCQKEHPMVTYQIELEQAVYRLLAQDMKIEDMTVKHAQDFSDSIFDWPPVIDALSTLQALKEMKYKIVLVSNLETELMANSLRESLEGFKVDWIYSGNNIMTFRPDTKNLTDIVAHIERDLRVDRGDVLYLSSGLKEDLSPAQALGLTTVGVTHGKYGANAVGQMSDNVANMSLEGKKTVGAGYRFQSLTAFVDACKRAHLQKR